MARFNSLQKNCGTPPPPWAQLAPIVGSRCLLPLQGRFSMVSARIGAQTCAFYIVFFALFGIS